jgi:hypothetical protein
MLLLFAQSGLDFGVSDAVLLIVRIIATVGGAIVGWFVCDPVTRLVYRLSFKGTTPGALLFAVKLSGAVGLALLIWFFMPLGGGGGGFGWGPGPGGRPGKGPGQGGDKGPGADPSPKNGKDPKSDPVNKSDPARSPIKIEILGGPRFLNDGAARYYLVLKKDEPARSLAEIGDYLKQYPPSLIEIVHSDDTAVDNTEESPTRKLRKLATERDIPTKGPKD